jgi:hypothetical protein
VQAVTVMIQATKAQKRESMGDDLSVTHFEVVQHHIPEDRQRPTGIHLQNLLYLFDPFDFPTENVFISLPVGVGKGLFAA